MKIHNQPVELIVNAPPFNAKRKAPFNLKKQLIDAGIPLEAILTKSAKLPASKKTGLKALPFTTQEKIYVRTKIKDSEMNASDVAHTASKGIGTNFVKTYLLQQFVVDRNVDAAYKRRNVKGKSIIQKSSDDGFDPDRQPRQNLIWHLLIHNTLQPKTYFYEPTQTNC